MAITSLIVRPDDENNAEAWWDALHEYLAEPNLAESEAVDALRRLAHGAGEVELTDGVEEFDRVVTGLPGWDDPEAPEYAPHPLTFEAT